MQIDDQRAASILSQRGVRFYHADNLQHIRRHFAKSALLSRQHLIKGGRHTVFWSDESDEARGVLGRVFGNIDDFGKFFARSDDTIPNVFGPILLIFHPQIFAHMQDIVITNASIPRLPNNWRKGSVSGADVDSIFAKGAKLSKQWAFAELSCANSSIPLTFLEKIVVEPICFAGRTLVDMVRNEARQFRINVPVHVRDYANQRNSRRLSELVDSCVQLSEAALRAHHWPPTGFSMPAWVQDIEKERTKRLDIWCRYFSYGTVAEVADCSAVYDRAATPPICQLCANPEGVRGLVRFRNSGSAEPKFLEGYCESCGGTSVACRTCASATPVANSEYGTPIACSGCGAEFVVTTQTDPEGASATRLVSVSEWKKRSA